MTSRLGNVRAEANPKVKQYRRRVTEVTRLDIMSA